MRFVLYANASEVKTGAEGHVHHYDFFCTDSGTHVCRKTAYNIQSGSQEVSWGKVTPCNGLCRVWLGQELNIPANKRSVEVGESPLLELTVSQFFSYERIQNLGYTPRMAHAVYEWVCDLARSVRSNAGKMTMREFLQRYPTRFAIGVGYRFGQKSNEALVHTIRAAGLPIAD